MLNYINIITFNIYSIHKIPTRAINILIEIFKLTQKDVEDV